MRHIVGALRPSLLAALFFCAISAGCDNTCVVFVSNPSGGNISVDTSTCSVKVGNATVRVRLIASSRDSITQWPAGVQHMFVTLRGAEARLAARSNQASADWQELALDLANKPVQVDLVSAGEEAPSPTFVGEGQIRAGAYSEVRLLLLRDASAEGRPVPEKNACGGAGFNCVVSADGRIERLVLGADSQILIPADPVGGGVFNFLPDTKTTLDLELSPRSALVYTWPSGLSFSPVFTSRSELSAVPPLE